MVDFSPDAQRVAEAFDVLNRLRPSGDDEKNAQLAFRIALTQETNIISASLIDMPADQATALIAQAAASGELASWMHYQGPSIGTVSRESFKSILASLVDLPLDVKHLGEIYGCMNDMDGLRGPPADAAGRATLRNLVQASPMGGEDQLVFSLAADLTDAGDALFKYDKFSAATGMAPHQRDRLRIIGRVLEKKFDAQVRTLFLLTPATALAVYDTLSRNSGVRSALISRINQKPGLLTLASWRAEDLASLAAAFATELPSRAHPRQYDQIVQLFADRMTPQRQIEFTAALAAVPDTVTGSSGVKVELIASWIRLQAATSPTSLHAHAAALARVAATTAHLPLQTYEAIAIALGSPAHERLNAALRASLHEQAQLADTADERQAAYRQIRQMESAETHAIGQWVREHSNFYPAPAPAWTPITPAQVRHETPPLEPSWQPPFNAAPPADAGLDHPNLAMTSGGA